MSTKMFPLPHIDADPTSRPCIARGRNNTSVSREQEHKPVAAVLLLNGVRDDFLLDIERIISENEEHGDEIKMNTSHQFTGAVDSQQGHRDSPASQHGDSESRIEFLGWSMPYPKDLWIPDYPDSERYWNYIRYAEAVDRLNKALAPGKPCRTCVEKLQRIYGQEPRLGRMPSSDEESMCSHAFSRRPEDNCSMARYYQGTGRTWPDSCSSGEDPFDLTDMNVWSEAAPRTGEKRERHDSRSPPSVSTPPRSPKKRMLAGWRQADDDSI